jgi:hypothetical protein
MENIDNFAAIDPHAAWPRDPEGNYTMGTQALDFDSLLKELAGYH